METKRYYLILMVVACILCIPALGEVETPLPSDKPLLIGRANPMLVGIEEFYVFIVQPSYDPNKDGLVWEELQLKIERKLKDDGIKHVKPRSLPTPQLRVYIDMLKLLDSQKYVFHIRTALARTLSMQRNLHLLVDVWKTEPVMQAVPVQSMPAKVTDVVLEQVGAFICAYRAANPPGIQPSDANDTATLAEVRAKPGDRPVANKYEYVASKNSKVFHKPNCRLAERISPKNLVGYSSREEAIEAGKRPCKRCKP